LNEVIDDIMKKEKQVIPFYFKDLSHQDIVDYFNYEYPISLKHNQELVERVYQRYPLINKSEIGLIIKAIFSCLRDLLILGKILNFNNFLFDAKLFFHPHRKAGVIIPAVKVKLSTPPPLRKYVR
jgi:hypothetical protein